VWLSQRVRLRRHDYLLSAAVGTVVVGDLAISDSCLCQVYQRPSGDGNSKENRATEGQHRR
jgi:hypothetical protein